MMIKSEEMILVLGKVTNILLHEQGQFCLFERLEEHFRGLYSEKRQHLEYLGAHRYTGRKNN
jgi:hypothetical protein